MSDQYRKEQYRLAAWEGNIPPYTVFVDIETTGLDPQEDIVLEVAMVALSPQAQVLYELSYPVSISNPEDFIREPIVLKMHQDNGLLHDCKHSGITLAVVEDDFCKAMEALQERFPDYQSPMAGSSVHFDRAFLKGHMPHFENKFHRRNIDVSSLKEVFRRHAPWVVEEFERDFKAHKTHRALGDVYVTIDEYWRYARLIERGAA